MCLREKEIDAAPEILILKSLKNGCGNVYVNLRTLEMKAVHSHPPVHNEFKANLWYSKTVETN